MGFVEIIGRRMAGGTEHEDVAEYRCVDREGRVIHATPAEVIAWLNTTTNVAMVFTPDRTKRYVVGVVRRVGQPSYLRASIDRKWTDDLLSVPEYQEDPGRRGGLPTAPRWVSAERPARVSGEVLRSRWQPAQALRATGG